MHLTVIYPFADYSPGDVITDQEIIKTILDGENAPKVVRVPQAQPKPAP